MDFELSRKTIGSFRTHEEVRKVAQFWAITDTVLMVWSIALILAIPAIAGFIGGMAYSENLNSWASEVTAQ